MNNDYFKWYNYLGMQIYIYIYYKKVYNTEYANPSIVTYSKTYSCDYIQF